MITRPSRRLVSRYTKPTNKRRNRPPWLLGAPEIRAMRLPLDGDSLLIGTVYFVLQFLEKLGALLGRQFTLQFLKGQRNHMVVMGPGEFGIGRNFEPQFVHQFDI